MLRHLLGLALGLAFGAELELEPWLGVKLLLGLGLGLALGAGLHLGAMRGRLLRLRLERLLNRSLLRLRAMGC